MYLNYYGLEKAPFNITPDPEFLFPGPSHREALASIVYGVQERKGFIAITGEVGVGKTTVLRSYLDSMDRTSVMPVYIFHANVPFAGLMATICRELGIEESSDALLMVDRLHQRLIECYRRGQNVVLIIDEAQNMPVETLENLRMLSNLETSKEKLMQIVLCGQPELETLLGRKELRQLKQRIAVKAAIKPLGARESMEYIRHRLKRSVARDAGIFTGMALKKIAREARGIPRVINILCDTALITAFGSRKRRVDLSVAREAAGGMGARAAGAPRRVTAALSLLLVASGFMWLYAYRHREERAAPVPPAAVERPPATSGAAPAAATKPGFPVYRVVEKGDTLTGLLQEVYGDASGDAIDRVKDSNSLIEDEDIILAGETIVFPEINR